MNECHFENGNIKALPIYGDGPAYISSTVSCYIPPVWLEKRNAFLFYYSSLICAFSPYKI